MNPDAFYYICHVDNLESIRKHGLLSRNAIKKQNIEHNDIHNADVLARRGEKKIAGDKSLPDFVNFYFEPRNAMLYRLICNMQRSELVIIKVAGSILESAGACFSDRNAAASDAVFYEPTAKNLRKINEKMLAKRYWTDSADTKQRMMAELLVPDKVAADHIRDILIYKHNSEIETRIKNIFGKEPVVQPDRFFYPRFATRISENISLLQGDMFFSKMQTFTISVNLQGVMGKGLASRTKYQFPDVYVRYQDVCNNGQLKIGKPILFKRGIRIEEELADDREQLKPESINGTRWFLFLATKRHWRENSRFEDIELSMRWLLSNYKKQDIESLALPALGCGLGNLHWNDVGPMMCYYLKQMDIHSSVYIPMKKNTNDLHITGEYLLDSYNPG